MIYQDLQTKHKTCELEQELLQGTTDDEFVLTLIKNNSKILLEATDKINVKVLYNPREEFGKIVYDGSFYLQSTDPRYAITNEKITAAEGEYTKISVPFSEEFVAYAGKNELILEIIRGEKTLYTFGMFYQVAINDGYSPKSTPDNLPSYEKIKEELETVKTQSNDNKNNIAANTQEIANKADDNLSNVGNFSTVPEGGILVKKNGIIDHAGIVVDGTNINAPGMIINARKVNVESNTVGIGPFVELHENAGSLEYHTNTLNKEYGFVIFVNNPVTGTSEPFYFSKKAKETQIIQAVNNQIMQNVVRFVPGHPTFSRQVQAISLDALNAINNLKLKILVNNIPAYYPSKLAWDGKEAGYGPFQVGIIKMVLEPEISNLTDYSIVIEMKADGPISLKGDGNIPWYSLDFNKITPLKVLVEGDAGTESPEEIVKAIESLAEDKKLDYATGLKNKPVLPSATTDFDDMPQSLVGQAGKMLQVKANTEGYELVDKPADGSSTFVGLTDTPSAYSGHGGKVLVVKDTGDGIEFRNVPGAIDSANKDLSNVINSDFKVKGVNSGLADNTDLSNIQNEVNRLKTDIAEPGLPTYVFRDRGLPTIPTDKQYKSYYIHILVLKDNTGIINIPAIAPNGAIFSIENNDRTDYVNIVPPSGETINGQTGSYECDFDTLNFLVKDGIDWKIAYAGVFPNNYDAMKSTINTLFPNSLHTIAEVEARIKDGLHTFREIQNEFASQFKTDAQVKALQDIVHFPTIAVMNQAKPTDAKIAIVDADDDGFVNYYKYNVGTSKWDDYPAKGLIISDIGGAIPKLIKTVVFGQGFTVQQAGDQEDAVLITYTPSGGGTGEITFTDTNTNSEFKSTQIKSTDKSIRIMENQDGSADLSKGANDRNEGIHVMLGNDELINSKFPKSKLYFGDFKVKGGSFVYPNMKNKSFILQDIDPQDDPNVSGGTTFFVAVYYEPNLNLENDVTQKGNIKIELVDNNDNPIMDVNGDPMGVQIDYEPNDISKRELYVGECQIKAYTEVHPKIELDFPSEEIISVGANTQICIQSVTKDESGGPALDSFMLYTGYRFGINTKYYGFNSMNLARTLVFPELENDTGADYHMDFGNNLYFDSITNCKISIAENTFIVKDDNVNLPVWSIARYYNGLDAIYMSGKNYKVTAKLQDKDIAFDISVLEYNGSDALPPKPKLLRYDNGSPAFTSGWSKIDTMFISEDIISGVHTATKDFLIPENSKGIAIIMYPNSSQIPTTLKLKDLEGDITPWFNKIVVTDNSRISEKYLLNHKENYISAVKTPSGISSYRYTVNALDTKLPIGVVSGGDGKIVNDNSWHDAGSTDPNKTQGDFKFLADGTVTMKYTARCLNEQATMNQIDFKLVKVSDDSDVTGSNYVTTIEGSRTNPKMVMSKEFTFDVKANETYRFIGKSDKDDGFYIQSALDGVPLIKFDIKFEEITAQDKAINDKLTLMDDEFVITPEAQQAGVYVEVDYKDGKPTMSTKIR